MHISVLILVALAAGSQAEVFTAMADMELILGAEKHVNNVIENYIQSEERRLKALKQFAIEYESRNRDALQLGIDHVANPVNAYLLIKRLTGDWAQVERLMRTNMADDFLANITAQRSTNVAKFPTKEDLNGAAVALMRLQDTYRLDTRDIADGKIKGARKAGLMNGQACFELGRTAYNQQDYYHTILWMQEALNRIENESPPTVEEADILEYLAFSLYQQGNVKRALVLTKKLVRIDPNNDRAEGNIKWYEDQLVADGLNPKDLSDLPPVSNIRPTDYASVPERDAYEKLCRGEFIHSPKEEAKLFCYFKRDRPYLLLAPIKVEIVVRNPLAVLFHAAMSDDEIEQIKELASPRLRRATVQNSQTGELETAAYRISKSAWLKEEDHPVVARVNARIDMMTNLNMDTAEELQIANYGLGGHYDVHFDHARRGEADPYKDKTGNRVATFLSYKEEVNAFKDLGTGNRIATFLSYMTDVEAGGATVFPLLNAAIFPQKGSALFWYNLYRDGEGDPRTRHAGCPVLAGVKWVSNKWIHERGQEWRRPCNADGMGENHNERLYIGELPDSATRYWTDKQWYSNN